MLKGDKAQQLGVVGQKSNLLLSIGSAFLNSYSIILFSNKRWLGFILLLATLNTPFIGVCGIIGVIIAIIVTRLLKFTTWKDTSGYYSFNSLLVSLSVAYFYPSPGEDYLFFFAVLILCSIIATLLGIALNQFFQNHLGLPSLSIAFVVITALVCLVYNRITGSPLSVPPHPLLIDWNLPLSRWLSLYFKSMGSIFFQTNLVGGLLVTVVIIFHSRIGLLLSLMGFAVGYYFLSLNTAFGELEIMLAGFNIILTAIVIGGVFLVPSIISFVIAAFASLSGALIGIATQTAFYSFGISPLAIPFNFTVLVILYAFKMRLKNSNPYLVDFYASSPEENLEYYYSRIIRFYEEGLPQFFLPFHGEWTVTQGHNSEPTHKLQWAEAWDLEIFDEDRSKFKKFGTTPKDFYCFDKPVIAPANGTVVRVVDGVEDNPINQINPRENWGNLVVIQHSLGIFSLLCHLKKESIEVEEGQYIRAGEKLALCGNSGRSPVPHLHFHLQGTPEPGSPTIKANLVNYIINNNPPAFIHSGIPKKDETIVLLQPEPRLKDMLHFKVNDQYKFEVTDHSGKTFNERWTVRVDFWGNLSIVSDRETRVEFSLYNGIFNVLKFKGRTNTALYALALGLSRFPYTNEIKFTWSDRPPINLVLPPFIKSVVDFFSFIARPVNLVSNYTAHSEPDGSICIDGKVRLNLVQYRNLIWNTRCSFHPEKGITELKVTGPRKSKVKARKVEEN